MMDNEKIKASILKKLVRQSGRIRTGTLKQLALIRSTTTL